jgi:UV DNA damage endonuclease
MRLGFAVKVLGADLKSNDSRRWQSEPHLRMSLVYLRAIFEYLRENGIRMYRMSSDLAPYLTHPDLPQFHRQIEECTSELAEIGSLAREYGIRLSFHPSQYIVLNSPDEQISTAAEKDLHAEAAILDAMGLDPEAVVVTHVGGVYVDRSSAMERFVHGYSRLSDTARSRLVLENDESRYSISDVLQISRSTGIRVVFDYLHHMNNNPEAIALVDALRASLHTWPSDVTPKIHFSSPRTEMREIRKKDASTGRRRSEFLPPLVSQHSDYINPFEFAVFMREAAGLRDFDVMLEAKAKDLALIRLREQLKPLAWIFER